MKVKTAQTWQGSFSLWTVLLVTVGIVLALGGLFAAMQHPLNADSGNAGASSAPTPQVHHTMFVHWTKTYHNLKDLKRDADLVVYGTIRAISSYEVDQGAPFTNFDFQVERVVHTSHEVFDGKYLSIRQTGGIIDGHQIEVQDDPLFVTGGKVVLFLKVFDGNKGFVIGGPTGRFSVINGRVTAFSPKGVALSSPAGLELDTFIAEIQRA